VDAGCSWCHTDTGCFGSTTSWSCGTGMFLNDVLRRSYTYLNLFTSSNYTSCVCPPRSSFTDMGSSPVPKGLEPLRGLDGWGSSLNDANGFGPENKLWAIGFSYVKDASGFCSSYCPVVVVALVTPCFPNSVCRCNALAADSVLAMNGGSCCWWAAFVGCCVAGMNLGYDCCEGPRYCYSCSTCG